MRVFENVRPLHAHLGAGSDPRALFRYEDQPNFPPRHNIAPTQPIAIVRLAEGKRQSPWCVGACCPPGSRDPKTFSLLINARGESVLDKPAFRAAMRRRRCLIPADGFYEWQQDGARKRPFFVRAKAGGPLAFAGLWETWTGPNGEEMETAAIVTTAANRTLAPIHDRMPVIVPPEAFDLWLDTAKVDATTAAALIAPAPEGSMEAYEISTAVNRVANDDARLIEPVVPGQLAPAPAKPALKPASAKVIKKDDGQGRCFEVA